MFTCTSWSGKLNCAANAGDAARATAIASGRAAGRNTRFMCISSPGFIRCCASRDRLFRAKVAAIVHSCQRLEKACGAHAGSDAHGHHPVLVAVALHAVDDRGGPYGARGPEGMAERDGAALRIHPGGVQAELADDGE